MNAAVRGGESEEIEQLQHFTGWAAHQLPIDMLHVVKRLPIARCLGPKHGYKTRGEPRFNGYPDSAPVPDP